jgi:predicted secreted hydrolase
MMVHRLQSVGAVMAVALALVGVGAGAQTAKEFRRADRPRDWKFPEDHGPHPEFQTEWWYITGNLTADRPTSGSSPARDFGFQFTIFRRGLLPEYGNEPVRASAWATRQVYLIHLGLSDLSANSFHHAAATRRPVLGQAGATSGTLDVRVDGNRLHITENGDWRVVGLDRNFGYDLRLRPTRDPLFHGPGGRDPKGAEPGQASYYYSMTRLEATGEVRSGAEGTSIPVKGLAWMDHEFMTSTLAPNQQGWDWFSAQLDDGSDLMIYQLRLEDGGIEPMSGGTLRRADGTTTKILSSQMRLDPLETWRSPKTGARYPIQWRIRVPHLRLDLQATSRAANQEMADDGVVGFSYYEGSTRFEGTLEGRPVQGLGYMELTGYQRSVQGRL